MKRLVLALALLLLPTVANAHDSIFDFPVGGGAQRIKSHWNSGWGGGGFYAEPGRSYTVQRTSPYSWNISPYGPGWSNAFDVLEQQERLSAYRDRRNAELWRMINGNR